ncbi:hypothetical protein NQ318_010263 [Aromia moschata]|uniref:Uncharacterized protein n=1 Tax=Aromia moschata TaxID=1265417 RepID=A0AAV8YL22_9CUCU|nr:hypothetical protein NQ318_010263 [Aromia moschata]
MTNEVWIPPTSYVTGARQDNVDYDTAYTGKDQYRNAYLVPYNVLCSQCDKQRSPDVSILRYSVPVKETRRHVSSKSCRIQSWNMDIKVCVRQPDLHNSM